MPIKSPEAKVHRAKWMKFHLRKRRAEKIANGLCTWGSCKQQSVYDNLCKEHLIRVKKYKNHSKQKRKERGRLSLLPHSILLDGCVHCYNDTHGM